MKWYCKYCDKTINEKRKKQHQLIRRHRIKARWHKCFSTIDRYMKRLNEEYKNGNYSVDEFNEIENQIYKEFDEADDMKYFDNIPDDSDSDDE